MVNILNESRDNLLAVRMQGNISKQDFEILNPVLEKTVEEHDDLYAYVEMLDFEKVTLRAIWEDLKNIKHYNKFEKVAIVGDAKWKELIAQSVGKFMKPKVKYFNYDEKANAMEWVKNSDV